MRFNDCIDCGQPIGMYGVRCDDCNEKEIQRLRDELRQEKLNKNDNLSRES